MNLKTNKPKLTRWKAVTGILAATAVIVLSVYQMAVITPSPGWHYFVLIVIASMFLYSIVRAYRKEQKTK